MKYAVLMSLGCVLAVAEGKDVICLKCLGCAQPDDPTTWCPDINRDGLVDHEDLVALISVWGVCHVEPELPGPRELIPVRSCLEDINGDEVVDRVDLSNLLAAGGRSFECFSVVNGTAEVLQCIPAKRPGTVRAPDGLFPAGKPRQAETGAQIGREGTRPGPPHKQGVDRAIAARDKGGSDAQNNERNRNERS